VVAIDARRLHRDIELFLNGAQVTSPLPEMSQFIHFVESEIIPRGWAPWRTEWSIFSEDHMVAGQIDSIWIDCATGDLHMIDWKRSKHHLAPHEGARWNRRGLPPVDFMIDNSWSHYVLQQNLYCVMLQAYTTFHCMFSVVELL